MNDPSTNLLADGLSFSRDIFTYYRPDNFSSEDSVRPYRLVHFRFRLFSSERVCLIVWDNDSTLNSLSPRSLWELFFLYEHFEKHSGVDVLLWTGFGRAFCSGISSTFGSQKDDVPPLDVRLGYTQREKGPSTSLEDGQDLALKGLVRRCLRFSKISVAAVNGMAVGGGANLAFLMHDFVFCGANGRYRYPFGELGLTAEVGSSWLLPRRIGMLKSKELLLTGKWFTAQEAESLGLCNKVFPAESLAQDTLKFCIDFLCDSEKTSHSALRETKKLLHRFLDEGLDAHLSEENKALEKVLASEDTKARMSKWKQKLSGREKKRSLL